MTCLPILESLQTKEAHEILTTQLSFWKLKLMCLSYTMSHWQGSLEKKNSLLKLRLLDKLTTYLYGLYPSSGVLILLAISTATTNP